MKRIKITIAYDGTDYHGWQIQPNALSIEEIINKAISKTTKEDIKIIGASRTDSGVHALGNIAVFDTNTTIPTEKIPLAVNKNLPNDIIITKAEEVDLSFHPRYGNITKTYEYTIWKNKVQNPMRTRYTCHHFYKLNIEKIKEAFEYLIGEHDFASFCSMSSNVNSTVRNIYSIDIEEKEDEIVFRFVGNGFLYHMIRIIMGIAIQIGDGYYEPIYLKEVLDKKQKGYGRPTAPASGLCLIKIDYK